MSANSAERPGTLASLRKAFGSDLLTSPVDLAAYAYDATGIVHRPDAVLRPSSPDEAAKALALAYEADLPILGRGAGTGLSGGAVPTEGGLLLSTEKLRAITAIDVTRQRALVQPGLVNERLQQALRPYGLFFGADPASQRASTLGGNIAENAGGPHAFKYGVTGHHVRRLQVILSDGVLRWLPASGSVQPTLDLTALLCGSEGTLGLIMAAEVDLLQLPQQIVTLLGAFADEAAALAAVMAIVAAGLVPATLELLDQPTVESVRPFCGDDYPADAGAVLLIEVDGTEQGCAEEASTVETLVRPHALQVTRARDEDQRQRLWLGRRGAFAALARYGKRALTQDVTVPRPRLGAMIAAVHDIAERYELMVATVAHAGDGNLHPDFPYDPEDEAMTKRVHDANHDVMKACLALDGSITGEHGVGVDKLMHQPLMFSPAELGLMWAVRQTLDPKGLLNPGKKIPSAARAPTCQTVMTAPGLQTPEEIAALILTARRSGSGIAVGRAAVPAGMTALSVAAFDEIEIDADNLTVRVGAGVPFDTLAQELAKRGLLLPVEAESPDQTIGAMISGNAYGPLAHRHGTLRRWLLELRFVTGAGEIVRFGRPIMKNVAGYNLQHLIIGSRGTLSVITSATLRLLRRPALKTFERQGSRGELVALAETIGPLAHALWLTKRDGEWTLSVQSPAAPDGFAETDALYRKPPAVTVQGAAAVADCFDLKGPLRWLPTCERLDILTSGEQPAWSPAAKASFLQGTAALFRNGRRLSPLPDDLRAWLSRLRKTFDPDGILNPDIEL